jgi:hypothetical protein
MTLNLVKTLPLFLKKVGKYIACTKQYKWTKPIYANQPSKGGSKGCVENSVKNVWENNDRDFGSTSSCSQNINGALRVLFRGVNYPSTLKVEKVGSFNIMVISTRLHSITSIGRKLRISHHNKIMSDNKKCLPLLRLTSANQWVQFLWNHPWILSSRRS